MTEPFYLVFPVSDLESTRAFYGVVLGCRLGPGAGARQDLDFFGHHLSAHVLRRPRDAVGIRDADSAPIPRFGVVLPMGRWRALAARLRSMGIRFLREPEVKSEGCPDEWGTMFVNDPSGNTLEFRGLTGSRAMADPASEAEVVNG